MELNEFYGAGEKLRKRLLKTIQEHEKKYNCSISKIELSKCVGSEGTYVDDLRLFIELKLRP